MPARRASSDSSPSATRDSPITWVYGRCRPRDSPARWACAIPASTFVVFPHVSTAAPDIHHPARLRMDRVQTRWNVLGRGPRWSRRPVDVAATASCLIGGLLLVWSAYIHFHLWGQTGG